MCLCVLTIVTLGLRRVKMTSPVSENWLRDFTKDANGTNICPINSSCITFEEMYSSGEGLCNKMWGKAFYYSSNTDNCTVMMFDDSMVNPNTRLSFPEILPGVSDNGGTQSTVVYGSVLIIMLLIAANILDCRCVYHYNAEHYHSSPRVLKVEF